MPQTVHLSSKLHVRTRRVKHDHNFNSLAILDAMFLKPIDVPDMRLNRMPLSDSRGSLQTSISHWTTESAGVPALPPWMHSSRKRSRCSKSQLLRSRTRRISAIMSFGSMALVVFMLHVKRNERGFEAVEEPAAPDDVECWSTLSRLSLPGLKHHKQVRYTKTSDVGKAVFTRPRQNWRGQGEARQGRGRGRWLEVEAGPRQNVQDRGKAVRKLCKCLSYRRNYVLEVRESWAAFFLLRYTR